MPSPFRGRIFLSLQVVALDENGNALRPALLWMDMRSAQQAKKVAECGDPALMVNSGGKVRPRGPAPHRLCR